VGTVPGTVLGAVFLRLVIDGVAKIIKTGADVYEGLIVGVVVVFAVAFSQSEGRGRVRFFEGALGFVAAINAALLAGAVAVLVGPTVLAGRTRLDGTFLGLWTGVTVLALLMLARSRLDRRKRSLAAVGLAIVAVAAYVGLARGVPLYRVHAATSAVRAAGGTMTADERGALNVKLDDTSLDDEALKAIVERLVVVPQVVELSLARTAVTDRGVASIKGLADLRRLDLSGTRVSRETKRALGRSLPDVEIAE
jgi:hypothetical protein